MSEATSRREATSGDHDVIVSKVLTGPEVRQLQAIERRLPISDHMAGNAVSLARASWPEDESAPGFTKEYVSWGAGAVQYLELGAKARAAIAGEFDVTCDHVRAVAALVPRHRMMPNFHGEAEGVNSNMLVKMLLDHVKEPDAEAYR